METLTHRVDSNMATESDKPYVWPVNPGEIEETFTSGNYTPPPSYGGGYGLLDGLNSTPAFYVQDGPGGLKQGDGNTIWGNKEAEGTGEPVSEGVLAKIAGLEDAMYEFLPEPMQKMWDVLNTDLTDVTGIDENSAIGALLNIATSWALSGPLGAAKTALDNPYVQDTIKGLVDGASGFDMEDWGISGGQDGLANIMSGNPSPANVESVQARALTYQQEAGLRGNDTRARTTYATEGSINVPTGGQTVQTGGSDGVANAQQAPQQTGGTPEQPRARALRPDYGTPDLNSGMDAGLLNQAYAEAGSGELQRPSILPAANSGQPAWQKYTERYEDPNYGGGSALIESQLMEQGLLNSGSPQSSGPQGLLGGDGTATQADKNAFWGAAVQQNPDAFNQQQKKDLWANLAQQQNPAAFAQQGGQGTLGGDGTATQAERNAFFAGGAQQAPAAQAPQDLGGQTSGGGMGGMLGVGGDFSLAAPKFNQATGQNEGGGLVRLDGGDVTAADRAGLVAEHQQGQNAFQASGGAQLQQERMARYRAAQQESLLGQAAQNGGLI
jgi:hypothetical protein